MFNTPEKLKGLGAGISVKLRVGGGVRWVGMGGVMDHAETRCFIILM